MDTHRTLIPYLLSPEASIPGMQADANTGGNTHACLTDPYLSAFATTPPGPTLSYSIDPSRSRNSTVAVASLESGVNPSASGVVPARRS